jgi:hypothetical protein
MNLPATLKALKFGLLTYPALKDNGAFSNNTYFDTLGLSGLLILIEVGAIDIGFGSTLASTPPLVEECNTTGGSYSAVTGAALSACPGASDDGKLYGIFVDLTKSHKRYMQVQAPTAGDGTAGVAAGIIAIGFPSDQMPASAAEMGLAELISA